MFFKKFGFWGILGQPYCGIGATIRIGREMLCLPFQGFFICTFKDPKLAEKWTNLAENQKKS